jgi:putative transposase
MRDDIELDDYIIMPNQLHAIINIRTQYNARRFSYRQSCAPAPPALTALIGSYKAAVTARLKKISGRQIKVWQRNYYQRVIGNITELYRSREYIAQHHNRARS